MPLPWRVVSRTWHNQQIGRLLFLEENLGLDLIMDVALSNWYGTHYQICMASNFPQHISQPKPRWNHKTYEREENEPFALIFFSRQPRAAWMQAVALRCVIRFNRLHAARSNKSEPLPPYCWWGTRPRLFWLTVGSLAYLDLSYDSHHHVLGSTWKKI